MLDFALKIQSAYSDYHKRVDSIGLTPANAKMHMFAFCKVGEQYGFLTKSHMSHVLLRLLRANPDDSVCQKWYNLDTQTLTADLSMGFVSQSTLAQATLFDMKLRSIKFISQKES